MNNRLGNRLKFYADIKKAVSIFNDVVYSIITGGFIQDDKKLGDVDIITVLPHITSTTIEKIMHFAEKHVVIQLNNFFKPDFNFPTDVISRQQIIDAVQGRALEIINGQLKLKEFSEKEIATNPEADYRVWLYEMNHAKTVVKKCKK